MQHVHVRRSLAFLIDLVVVSIVASILGNVFPIIAFKLVDFDVFGQQFRIGIAFVFIIWFFYLMVFDVINNGQTIGKWILQLAAVTKNHEIPPVKTRITRSLLKTLSIIILPIAVLLFLFGKSYTIHERYSYTITIKAS